jgi:hypothetical protein
MLVADRMSSEQRRAVGWTLAAVGAITTIPIAIQLFGSHERSGESDNGRPARFASEQAVP